MQRIEITGTGRNIFVRVDGQSIECTEADLHVGVVGSLPVLTVAIDAPQLAIETEGLVKVDERTAGALVTLGWTPPD